MTSRVIHYSVQKTWSHVIEMLRRYWLQVCVVFVQFYDLMRKNNSCIHCHVQVSCIIVSQETWLKMCEDCLGISVVINV